jgi:hypothetical protein
MEGKMDMRGKTAITGMAESKPTMAPGDRGALGLLSETAGRAIREAGLTKTGIDGLIVTPPIGETSFMWPAQVAEYLKMSPVFSTWWSWQEGAEGLYVPDRI